MSDFNLGDIVALKSHPYLPNLTSIILSGEPQLISPLMVIVELLNDTKDLYDEKTGEEISNKRNAQCKCIWYSNKSHQFEETWISSRLLKHIKFSPKPQKDLDETQRKELYGRLVLLKTSMLEGDKQKSSLSLESNSFNTHKDKNVTTPLLSYLCPVMQIIQVTEAKNELKEISFDQKTGKPKRFTSKYFVKCKWYNPNDKLSEKLLPIECLEIIPELKHELLENIQTKIIEAGVYLYSETNHLNKIYKETILQPQKIWSMNGFYFLKAFDYVSNKTIDIELFDDIILKEIDKLTYNEVPVFELKNGDKLPIDYFESQFISAVKIAEHNKTYIRIKYKNRMDEISTRTLKNCEIIEVEEGLDTKKQKVHYLKAFCMTRNDYRTFRLDRIHKLEGLNLTF